jgi:branched-chain amino acid transport system ATP-binding protein
MALLEVEDLRAAYGPVRALHGVSFAVEEGAIVAMLGANGAGKSTTLRAVTGMVKPQGEVRFAGRPIAGKATETIARLGIAHVPEGRGVFVHLSVHDNLRMGAYTRRDSAAVRRDFDRVFGYFPRLAERRAQVAGTLSGGEQQMLAIGRALMLRPRLLLLDEPSLGLAPLVVREIFAIIAALNREEGTTVLLVEQNATLALRLSSHAYVLETGRVAVHGPSAQLQQEESVRRSYLGY